jgi:hypothetical protein|tara:strand:- start:913 stop:1098 length:186 start_codon:yes stop_codon:yes gene_type:complete
MIKEFQTKDILEAIEIISKMDKKKREIENKKIINKKDDVLTVNNQVKSTKSDILVLKEMIE